MNRDEVIKVFRMSNFQKIQFSKDPIFKRSNFQKIQFQKVKFFKRSNYKTSNFQNLLNPFSLKIRCVLLFSVLTMNRDEVIKVFRIVQCIFIKQKNLNKCILSFLSNYQSITNRQTIS